MNTTNSVIEKNWVKIAFGGIGKAHYAAYMKEIESKDKNITVGRISYRASTLMMAEMKIFALGERYLTAGEMRDLLIKFMSYTGKSFERNTEVSIGGYNFKLLIKISPKNVISELFTISKTNDKEMTDIEEVRSKLD